MTRKATNLMNSSLTPLQVMENLTNIGREIDKKTKELEDLDRTCVLAQSAYTKARAKSFLTTEGSMDIRRFTADLKTESLSLEYELAEQQVRACRDKLRALRDRLEIGRSLSPLLRLEWGQS